MTPVSESPATALPIALLSSAEPWRNSLLFLNHHGRSTRFNALIAKFTVDTNAIPGEDEWNDLVLECMLHRAVKPLTDILAENPLQTLSITRPVETTDAWKTLEAALPASCSILHLVVSHQNLSEGHASLLLSIMGRMPKLHSLRVDACTVGFASPLKFSSPTLRSLYVTRTKKPYFLLESIIKGSSLSKVYLNSNPGMTEDDDLCLFQILSASDTLRELALRNMSAERNPEYAPFYRTYVHLADDVKTLTHLDLSHNPLNSGDCDRLKDVLQKNTTLTSLSLAGCWPKPDCKFRWDHLAKIVEHKSLVCLDLSHNALVSEAAPVLKAIQAHPALQRLYLAGITVTDLVAGKALPDVLANNTTLIFLRLPPWPDSAFAPLCEAMEKNHILRCLSIPHLEQQCSLMGPPSLQVFKHYSALMERISRNHRLWDDKRTALIEGGLTVVMGMEDVAHYMAPYVYATGNGDEAMNLTLLNKAGHRAGLKAIESLQGQGEKKEK